MKAIVMTISLIVLGSCAHHGSKSSCESSCDKTTKTCKADKSCCKGGSCEMKKKS